MSTATTAIDLNSQKKNEGENPGGDTSRPHRRNLMQFARQADLIPPEKLRERAVTIIGAGSLGSASANALAQVGIDKISIYDDDIVEIHNIAVQFFKHSQVQQPPLTKVEALRRSVQEFHDVSLDIHPSRYTGKEPLNNIVVSAVDDMGVRKMIWETIKLNPGINLFIDCRAAGQVAEIFCINPLNMDVIKQYESLYIFPQEEGIQGPCTAKMTTYMGWSVAAHVSSLVVDHINNGNKEMPFKITLDMYNHTITHEAYK